MFVRVCLCVSVCNKYNDALGGLSYQSSDAMLRIVAENRGLISGNFNTAHNWVL